MNRVANSKQNRIIEHVTIQDIGSEGVAVARVDQLVVFVPHAVPGDVVDLEVRKKKKNFLEAAVIRFHSYSPDRVTPVCAHFTVCGGCKWQDLPYEKQLWYKQKQVTDNLVRLGHLDLPPVLPILGSENQYHYRNKMEFTFSDARWFTREELESGMPLSDEPALGFHVPGFFDKIVDIKECHLQADPSNQIRLALKAFAVEQQIPFFSIRQQTGFLRTVVIRTASTGEVMVILNLYTHNREMREKLLSFLGNAFPQITSLMYVVNEKPHDGFADLPVQLYKGRDHILEKMEGLTFKVGPKSFYQTNSLQAYRLYSVVREFAALTGKECLYDLYTGTGTIANFLAPSAEKVVGIEYVPEAVEDARENARMNGLSHCVFFAGDMKDLLTPSFVGEHGHPDVMVLDPPRAGVHPHVLACILQVLPKTLVYVSCNPATQARDLSVLQEKYVILAVQPVDMFPQTHHVENVVKLSLRQ